MKVVIIGGVAGGASCAARLRRLDEKAEIVLLERGDYISYANCGLPYHVGGVIESRNELLLQTPEAMKQQFRIDVRVRNEAIAIDREQKVVTVKRLTDDEIYQESYDVLVLSTGSSPLRPPIPGIESERIHTLWTVTDTDRICALIQKQNIQSAAVIGGGFIGLEMAENLRLLGLNVSLIEMQDQVMAPMDYEMAQLLHENIVQNGVKLHLSDGVSSFKEENGQVSITLNSGNVVSAEMVILSIGVHPNGELAKAEGLQDNARGGIIVDKHLLYIRPVHIRRAIIEVNDFVFGEPTMVPLADPNKQGRIAADNIAGGQETYEAISGYICSQVFDLTAASTV